MHPCSLWIHKSLVVRRAEECHVVSGKSYSCESICTVAAGETVGAEVARPEYSVLFIMRESLGTGVQPMPLSFTDNEVRIRGLVTMTSAGPKGTHSF